MHSATIKKKTFNCVQ